MSTKNNPDKEFDCYANAHPDEPMFHLRSTDVSAPYLVRAWAFLRMNLLNEAISQMHAAFRALERAGKVSDGKDKTEEQKRKLTSAFKCAIAMDDWRLMQDKIADEQSKVDDFDWDALAKRVP